MADFARPSGTGVTRSHTIARSTRPRPALEPGQVECPVCSYGATQQPTSGDGRTRYNHPGRYSPCVSDQVMLIDWDEVEVK